MKQLVIAGDSSFAEIAQLYFSRDSDFQPVAHVVDDHFLKRDHVGGLDVLPMSQLTEHFDPATTCFYAAIVYTKMNRVRRDLYRRIKAMGYSPASFVSPYAYVDSTAVLGEHVFVFEDNTIQAFTEVRDNVVLWSGNHIGHHTVIREDVFVSSHVVVSGHCDIGARSFLGVNASVANNVRVGDDNWLSPGACVLKDTETSQLWLGPRASLHAESSLSKFGVEEAR